MLKSFYSGYIELNKTLSKVISLVSFYIFSCCYQKILHYLRGSRYVSIEQLWSRRVQEHEISQGTHLSSTPDLHFSKQVTLNKLQNSSLVLFQLLNRNNDCPQLRELLLGLNEFMMESLYGRDCLAPVKCSRRIGRYSFF